MRRINAGLMAILAVFVFAVSSSPIAEQSQPLIGGNKCTWGPSYWCTDFSTSKNCKATHHCIQTVWEKRIVEVDNDSVCQICKDMVTQARDQLRSNETEEEIKEVLEGSCRLLPTKLIKKECIKLADDFIPELIEALSSQMNPDQVCSVAGLCNSAHIDRLLREMYQSALDGTLKEEEEATVEEAAKPVEVPNRSLSCGNCNELTQMMHSNFKQTNRDDIVEQFLHVCGRLSSFSDACASIVLNYFNEIYDHVSRHLEGNAVCHLSGVCAEMYHVHKEDNKAEVSVPLSFNDDPDIPCELCEQLVRHLRDVLVANTTESEFKQVLQGFCKQMGSFKDECLSIVDQYYHVIYSTLVNDLDANGACFLIGVCRKNANGKPLATGPIMPLLPVIAPAEVHVTIKKLGSNEPKFTQDELMAMTLPIDHLMGAANPSQLVNGGELCTVCEYLLHFIQETLATPATSDEIKHTVETICQKMPKGVIAPCDNFVEMYGDAVIALLVQGLDPRSICPMMQMCPKNIDKHEDIDVFFPNPTSGSFSINDEQDKPTCPLCLFAVEEAQIKIRNDKSKEHVKQVLAGLCDHLPEKLKNECQDFVNTYTNELLDMLVTDFKPQEICKQLKLCTQSTSFLEDMSIALDSDESGQNEIDSSEEEDFPVEIAFEKDPDNAPNCLLCEELVKEAEKKMGKHTTKEEIKQALAHSCDKFRKVVQTKCHKVVDKYGDKIAELLIQEMNPKIICTEIGMCLNSEQEDLDIDEALKYDVIAFPKLNTQLAIAQQPSTEPPSCVLCEFVMTKLELELKDKTEQDEIKNIILNICSYMPKTVHKQCDAFINSYASAIIDLISKVPPKEICQKIALCFSTVLNDEVVECGVCHGATQALFPFVRAQQQEDRDNLSTQQMINAACDNLPAKYYTICSEMVKIYGISMKNLALRPYMDQSHVCAEIGKCFDSEKSGLAFARISA